MSSADGPPAPDPWAPPPAGQPPPPPYQQPGQQPAYQQPYPPPAYQQPYPPLPYQQPYWPVQPPAPRGRRGWVLWVVLAGVLVVGGCGALIATVGVHAYHDIDGARSAADDFMSAVEQGDRSRAQALLCDAPAPFVLQRAASGGVVTHRITGVGMHSSFGARRAAAKSVNVTVELTLDGGTHEREVLVVDREHDAWRVCDVFRIGSAG